MFIWTDFCLFSLIERWKLVGMIRIAEEAVGVFFSRFLKFFKSFYFILFVGLFFYSCEKILQFSISIQFPPVCKRV